MSKKRKKYNLKSRIISALRKIWLYSPLRAEALRRSKVGPKLYKCEHCEQEFDSIQVNHIEPVIDEKEGFVSWDKFINRLLECSPDNLECLCKNCHERITKQQQEIRKAKKYEENNKVKSPKKRTRRKQTD